MKNARIANTRLLAKNVKLKRGRPRLSDAERERRAAALAAATAAERPRKRVKRAGPVAAKKREQMDHAASWRASYVSARYSVSMSFVYKLVRNGTLPSKHAGRTTLIAAAACIAYFEGGES